jgi:excinuclease UvrABC nuclease subunit
MRTSLKISCLQFAPETFVPQIMSSHTRHNTRTRFCFFAFLLKAEEADMKDANTYREYAADCRRMAKLMNQKDQEVLLKMAAAWEDRAKEAERRKDGG